MYLQVLIEAGKCSHFPISSSLLHSFWPRRTSKLTSILVSVLLCFRQVFRRYGDASESVLKHAARWRATRAYFMSFFGYCLYFRVTVAHRFSFCRLLMLVLVVCSGSLFLACSFLAVLISGKRCWLSYCRYLSSWRRVAPPLSLLMDFYCPAFYFHCCFSLISSVALFPVLWCNRYSAGYSFGSFSKRPPAWCRRACRKRRGCACVRHIKKRKRLDLPSGASLTIVANGLRW